MQCEEVNTCVRRVKGGERWSRRQTCRTPPPIATTVLGALGRAPARDARAVSCAGAYAPYIAAGIQTPVKREQEWQGRTRAQRLVGTQSLLLTLSL